METRTNCRLDNQDAQIKQLQTDVADMRTSLAALETDRLESGEFRKVVLAWMSKQEKKTVGESSGSGTSGGEFTFSGSHPRSDLLDTSDSVPWAVKKVKLPEFSCFDPQGWIQKVNLYFDMNHTTEDARLRLVRLSMIGVAHHWFTIITQIRPTISWIDFQSELLQRFSGLVIQNPFEQLATINQGDSIYDYIDGFEYLLSLVPRLPESQSIGYFVAGLKNDVKKWVHLHRPQSRLDAMYLAKHVELMLRPESGQSSLGRFRYLNPTGSQTFGLKEGPQGRSESRSFFSPKVGKRVSSPKLESPRSVLSPKLPFPMTDSGQGSPRDRGVRSLSRTEWKDRRKKGLCFRCGQQYGPTHKCPEGRLLDCWCCC